MSKKPTHPNLFIVKFGPEGTFTSCLIALKVRTDYKLGSALQELTLSQDFTSGELIAPIINTRPGPKMYSSVQVAADPPIGNVDAVEASRPRHIELMSDMLYINHS
ncbi:hypothetical protein RQP46_007324 [Phenoliferia psychrophenolica]